MQNRIPTPGMEGRVKLIDEVTGEERFFTMEMADEPVEEGTPLNKANLFSDQTRAAYPANIDTPNDAFAKLSGAAMIKKAGGEPTVLLSLPEGAEIIMSVGGINYAFKIMQHNYPSTGNTLMWSPTYSLPVSYWASANNAVYSGSLVDVACNSTFISLLSASVQSLISTVPIASFGGTLQRKAFALSATELGNHGSFVPAYVEGTFLTSPILSDVRKFTEYGSYWARSQHTTSANAFYYDSNGLGSVSQKTMMTALIRPAFCFSTNLTVYRGADGKYYLSQSDAPVSHAATDILGNIIGGFTRMETFGYIGTGTYGAANPNSVTFSGTPKLVFISGGVTASTNIVSAPYIWGRPFLPAIYGATILSGAQNVTVSENTMQWYHATNANSQMNALGTIYTVVAAI